MEGITLQEKRVQIWHKDERLRPGSKGHTPLIRLLGDIPS